MELQWTNDLTTGISVLDDQHKELFDAANDLLRACSRGDAKNKATMTLIFLNHYVDHFATEEELMQSSGYPGYLDHKRHHDEFRNSINAIQREIADHGVTTDIIIRINTLLIHWLGAHIRNVDHSMAEYLRSTAFAEEPALA